MLYDLVIGIKFRKYSNTFQKHLKEDIKKIVDEERMFIAADKTTNLYKVTNDKHDELLKKQINKDYKKADEKTVKDITNVDKRIASKLELEDRVYSTSRRQAFITLKDHKPNFQNVQSCRLLNPTKSEIGQISEEIVEKIVKTVREKTGFNHWKNTQSVINWFKNIKDKKRLRFVQFDICDFYATISEDLLIESLDFASNYVDISDDEREQSNLYCSTRKIPGPRKEIHILMSVWAPSMELKHASWLDFSSSQNSII